MSLTISDLQSFRDKTREQINQLEYQVRVAYNDLPYRVGRTFFQPTATEIHLRKQIRKMREEIALLVTRQKGIKQQIRELVYLNRCNALDVMITNTRTSINPILTTDFVDKIVNTGQTGVGDVNGTEKGTAARFNGGKPDLSLIPLNTLHDEARVWMYGAQKYSRNNWKRGMQWSIPLACALRHIGYWQDGEDLDQESGLPHLAHAMCNLRMLTYYVTEFQEGDDRK